MSGKRVSPVGCVRFRLLTIFSIVLLILSQACSNPVVPPAKIAAEAIDRAIQKLKENSEQWQSIIKQLANELPDELKDTIRVEVNDLVTKSIAKAGVEFRCDADFLANRAIQHLEYIKAELLGGKPTSLPPMFCILDANAIDLNVNPENWRSITLHGYDMDIKDQEGNLFGIKMLDDSGKVVGTIPESKIFRNTHYEVSVAVDTQMATEFFYNRVAKLAVSWSGKYQDFLESQGQVGIIHWDPIPSQVDVLEENCSEYTPPLIRGDGDFNTHDDDPTSVYLQAETKLSDNKQSILGRTYFWASEEHADHTTVEGTSEWDAIFTAEPFYEIVSYPIYKPSVQKARVTTQGELPPYKRLNGEVVKEFVAQIDRNGDEAGSYTKVTTCWRRMTVSVIRVLPGWLK